MADTPLTPDDQELARDAQNGSLAAFEELVRRHEARLFHFLCQKMPSREDAEDMAQKSLITAWQNFTSIVPKPALPHGCTPSRAGSSSAIIASTAK